MYELLLRPDIFFARQSSDKPELFFPGLITVSISGIGLAIALEVSRGLSVNQEFEVLRWRISVLTSVIAALANFMLWPLVCGVILAAGLILWNRSVSYRRLLAAVGYAQFPMLLAGIITLILVIRKPVVVVAHDISARDAQDYLYQETVLGMTRYVSAIASLWTGILLTLAVRHNLRLDLARSALTVVLPYAVYRTGVFLFGIAR